MAGSKVLFGPNKLRRAMYIVSTEFRKKFGAAST